MPAPNISFGMIDADDNNKKSFNNGSGSRTFLRCLVMWIRVLLVCHLLLNVAANGIPIDEYPQPLQKSDQVSNFDRYILPYLLGSQNQKRKLASQNYIYKRANLACVVNGGMSHSCDHQEISDAMKRLRYLSAVQGPGKRGGGGHEYFGPMGMTRLFPSSNTPDKQTVLLEFLAPDDKTGQN